MRTHVAVFELRLSHSGVAVHVAFGSEGQEAFLQGHVTAFARLGGAPAPCARVFGGMAGIEACARHLHLDQLA